MKPRKSKLDAHAEQLTAWHAAKVTLDDMQGRLAALGCAVSLGRLSTYLESQRQQALQVRVLGNIASGSKMGAEIEAAFRRNPEPAIATLVSFIKRLILQLNIEGSANPELLETANTLFKSLMDYLKVEQKGQELRLRREEFQRKDDAFLERLLKRAEEINTSGLSHAEKIAAMRKAAFADVDALQAEGTIQLPG